MSDVFTPDEEDRIARAVRAGEDPPCPRCGGAFSRRAVPARSDVAYMRDRVWLVCAKCGRSAILDRRRLGADSGG